MTFNGNSGNDSLILTGANTATLTLTSVESLVGGTGNDTITLGSVITGLTFNGNGGTDSLTLADGGGNSVTTSLVASVTGGTGNDTIVGLGSNIAITAGRGADTITGGTLGANTTFNFASGDSSNSTASISVSSSQLDTITNWLSGDQIVATSSGGLSIHTNSGVSGTSATISSSGLATFASAASFNAELSQVAAAMNGAAAGSIATWYNSTGSGPSGSFVYVTGQIGTGALTAQDLLINLTGITVSSGLTITSSNHISTIG